MRREKCDRISSLPDAVLCHILSFLPTKYSIRTRLLSTRWKYLFALVPILDFDYFAGNNNINDESQRRFTDFVNKMVMMYNMPQMTRFRLVGPYITLKHLHNVVSWIWSVICRNVQELDISMSKTYGNASPGTFRITFMGARKYKTRLPVDLFLCEKLSILKLDGPFEIKLPKRAFLPPLNRAFLPCLKTLHLRDISFISFDGNILSICPALEDLLFVDCDFGKVLDISHPILRKLRIVDCYEHELVLNAPSLVCFEYVSSTKIEVRGPNVMTSLVKAEISPENGLDFDDCIAKLVTLVSHARHLCLSTCALEACDGSFKAVALPTFHNLTRLEVGTVTSESFKVVPDILNRCSLLEVLVFSDGFYYEEPDECCMKCYENVPPCVSVHLKEVEF